MPEGDTLARTADGLRPHLVGRTVTRAVARMPGPRVERVIGRRIDAVNAVGKNLRLRFDNRLVIRTHLRMRGSWHRYRPGETWRRSPARAVLVVEVPGAIAVCFDAPVVELFEARAESVHPALGALGPDVLAADFPSAGVPEAIRRLREAGRASTPIAEALIDQRAAAGIGNVYKSEVLWLERVDPFVPVSAVPDDVLGRLLRHARELMLPNADRTAGIGRVERTTTGRSRNADGPLWVYGRGGRPCRRCGSPIVSRNHGDLPRTTWWCRRCQPPGSVGLTDGLESAGGVGLADDELAGRVARSDGRELSDRLGPVGGTGLADAAAPAAVGTASGRASNHVRARSDKR